MSFPFAMASAACGLELWAAAFAVARVISASNAGPRVLKVANVITPTAIATNNIGGQTLEYCRRRKTSAGLMKMSMTSSQNDTRLAGAVVELTVSVIAGGG